jgi:dihydroneopterin aldolase
MNEILLHGLSVHSCIGVPDEERSRPQHLLVDVVLSPQTAFDALNDDILHTADYAAAATRIASLAAARPRRLIETLAHEIAVMLLAEFPITAAEVQIRKFILPNTEFVAVRCRRTVD